MNKTRSFQSSRSWLLVLLFLLPTSVGIAMPQSRLDAPSANMAIQDPVATLFGGADSGCESKTALGTRYIGITDSPQ